MTEAAGPAAAIIETFWWAALIVFGAVFVATMTAVTLAVRRGASEAARPSEARMRTTVAAAVALTLLVIFAYLIGDLATGRAVHRAVTAEDPLTIEVTGRQWWWDVEYADADPSRRLRTANEIHIPVGRPVRVVLRSSDVIHSLWIPSLAGKRDMIPARRTELRLQAERPGVFVGQCSEFCGQQHAHMALDVVAESPESFRAWYARQLLPARDPPDSLAARGLDVLLARPCAACHSIRGTPAAGRVAPDLTHLASRRRLAAGTIPNARGWLAGWLLDPQTIKPGAHMPLNPMSSAELEALLAYLESLR